MALEISMVMMATSFLPLFSGSSVFELARQVGARESECFFELFCGLLVRVLQNRDHEVELPSFGRDHQHAKLSERFHQEPTIDGGQHPAKQARQTGRETHVEVQHHGCPSPSVVATTSGASVASPTAVVSCA